MFHLRTERVVMKKKPSARLIYATSALCRTTCLIYAPSHKCAMVDHMSHLRTERVVKHHMSHLRASQYQSQVRHDAPHASLAPTVVLVSDVFV